MSTYLEKQPITSLESTQKILLLEQTINFLQKKIRAATHWYKRMTGMVSQHSAWKSDLLLERTLHDERYQDMAEMRQLLFDDWKTLTDEMALSMTPFYQFGEQGVNDSYQESLVELAENFATSQQQKGAPDKRALTELKTSVRLIDWIQSPQTSLGKHLIWISPRGSKAEGYPGEDQKNPVMINVYEKRDEGTFLKQSKSWASNQQLHELQQQLALLGQVLPQKEELAHQFAVTHPNHQIIDSLVELPPTVPYNQIEHYIYTTEQTWAVKRSDFPTFDHQEFNFFREEIYTHLEQAIINALFKAQQLQSQDLLTTKDYKKTLRHLDELIYFAQAAILKWIENQEKQLESIQVLHNFALATTLSQQKAQGISLSMEQVVQFAELSRFFTISGRFLGLLQCGTFTPFTLPITIMKQPFSLGSLGEFQVAVESMSAFSRLQLFNEISNMSYQQVVINGTPWMVPASYLETTDWLENNPQFLGPCNIPLTDDPLAFQMTEPEFNQYLQQLQSSLQQEQIASIEEQLEKIPADDLPEAQQLVNILKRILLKESVGLNDLLNNTLVTTESYFLLEPEDLQKLTAASGPTIIEVLRQIAHKLLEEQPLLKLELV